MAQQSKYQKTYTTFSGADIVATFNGRVVGELQAITYSVTREKAPVYTMGSPDPRSFSRGKRGIAGSLVFTVFDRDVFHTLKSEEATVAPTYSTAMANITNPDSPIQDWDGAMQELYDADNLKAMFKQDAVAMYADQIPPFDITITFMNEYGQSAKMVIFGVEILNEGSGMSIDDITTEKACTFVARGLSHLTSI